MSAKSIAVVILAAGLGTRMKSKTPKVLHHIFDRPMVSYVLDSTEALKPQKTILTVNSSLNDIADKIDMPPKTVVAIQKNQRGTADALKSALSALKGFKGTVIVTNGDTPLVTGKSLKKFASRHKKAKNSISVLSFNAANPTGYGRIVRGAKNIPLGIVEEKDASADEKLIREVNSGIYAIEPDAIKLLSKIKLNKKKKEYYLTDIIALALKGNMKVGVYASDDEDEFTGINSRKDLLLATEIMRSRRVDDLMVKGVTFIDSFTAYIGPDVKIGADTVIYPNVYIHGSTKIGRGCSIFPNSRIVDSTIKNGAIIKDSTLIEQSTVGREAQVGPMAHIRPLSIIGDRAKIGNFVEIKKSTIGKGAKASHLSYIGDATVGSEANIGAGTITCNYDGKRKFATTIGKDVFIGSDTQLVAPVTLGDGAYVGAGSTITRDVPPGALAVSRTKQKTYKRRGM